MKIFSTFKIISYVVLGAFIGLSGSRAIGAFLPVFGGPEYSMATTSGYRFPNPYEGAPVNNSGIAVGGVTKYVSGVANNVRAMRWDASGSAAIELGQLGGSTFTSAQAVNNLGVAIGYTTKYVSGVK